LFFFDEDRIGVVHGFIKKTRRTPEADLELARKRMREMKQ
jgi:phage-related protein